MGYTAEFKNVNSYLISPRIKYVEMHLNDDLYVEEIVISSFKVAKTVHGAKVKLYSDVLERIIRKHGELRGCEHMILETIERPDYIIKRS